MSERNVDPELGEFFRRVPAPQPSDRLRHELAAARAAGAGGAAGRHLRLREDSRLGLSLVALAASVALSAGLLFTVYGRGGLGGGPGGSAEPSASGGQVVTASPAGSATAQPSATPNPSPSTLASPTPTRNPAFTFGPAGKFKAVGSTTMSPSYAVRLPDGRVFITDGESVQLFNPGTNRFGTITKLSVAHVRGTVTGLPDGTVLLAGGMDTITGAGLDSATIYDPATGLSSAAGSLSQRRFDQHALALSDGRVLVFGGYSEIANQTPLVSSEIYDPARKQFIQTGNMVASRGCAAAVLMADGRVLVAGSERVYGTPVAGSYVSAEVFDPATNRYTATGSLTLGRDCAAGALLPDGRVLISGGDTQEVTAGTADVYDPRTGKFSRTGDMVIGRFSHNATVLADGRILITGGYKSPFILASVNLDILAITDQSYLAWAELYDPWTGKFSKVGPMLSRRVGQTSTLLLDGRVLLVGGNLDTTSAETYVP